MYTPTAEDGSDHQPTVVQICPWYLDKYLNPPAQKDCNAWQKKLKAVVDKLGMAHKTAADGLVDFVHTMMHELTHTKAGGQTNDSAKPGFSGGVGEQFFNKDSYGWSNCVGLKSASNADSIARLGTMVESITACGLAPTKEGDMNPIPGWTAPLRRLIRSLPSKKQLRAWVRQASSI